MKAGYPLPIETTNESARIKFLRKDRPQSSYFGRVLSARATPGITFGNPLPSSLSLV